MAGLIPLGAIVDPSRDVFPSTGAHLDVRVIPQFGPQKGKKIDPKTARSLLQNVLVGPNKMPLVQQSGDDWKWNFPITSGFGPRRAPTAGASTYHRGIDLSIGAGTPLTYKGYGSFRPDSGFGSLMTTDAQGNPYELRFLHTEPGKAVQVGDLSIPAAPELPPPPGGTQTTASASGSSEDSGTSRKERYMKAMMFQGLLSQMNQPSMTDQLLAQFMQSSPYQQVEGLPFQNLLG